jgi:kynurenine formamidase
VTVSERDGDPGLSSEQFAGLFSELSAWGRWGDDDERGALHHLTPGHVAAAAALVRDGVTVTLSLPLNTESGIHNPEPAVHYMTAASGTDIGSGSLHFLKDFVGVDYHNDGHSHIDALCHIAYRGMLYNGKPEDAVGGDGAPDDAIGVLENGLVGRGVLLDIPRVRGERWLEPGEHVFRDDLERAEHAQGVTVGEGDILLVNVGHARRLAELGPWDTANAKAGLHPTALSFVAERRVAALGSDGNSDTAPSSTEGIDFPIHVLAINAMGVHLLDYLQFADLGAACERRGRWEFMFAAAPLRIVGGTGSPVNPLAIF